MTEILLDRNVSYNLPRGSDALFSAIRTTTYGIEMIRFIENKLWEILLPSLKSIPTIEKFKKEIRSQEGALILDKKK